MSTHATGEGLTVARVPTFVSGSLSDGATNTDGIHKAVAGFATFASAKFGMDWRSYHEGQQYTHEKALNHHNSDNLWEADGGFQYGLDITFNDENIAQLLGDLSDELNRPTFLTRSGSGDVVPSEMVSCITCSELQHRSKRSRQIQAPAKLCLCPK